MLLTLSDLLEQTSLLHACSAISPMSGPRGDAIGLRHTVIKSSICVQLRFFETNGSKEPNLGMESDFPSIVSQAQHYVKSHMLEGLFNVETTRLNLIL